MRTDLDALQELRSIYEERLKDLQTQLAMEERRVEALLKSRRDLIAETIVLLGKADELLELARRNEERTTISPSLEAEKLHLVEPHDAHAGEDPIGNPFIGEPVVSISDADGVLTMIADVESVIHDSEAKPSKKARTAAQFILERADRPMLINEIVEFFGVVGLATEVDDQGKVTRKFRDIVRKAIEGFDTYRFEKNNYYWWPKGRKPHEGSIWSNLLVEQQTE